LSLFLALNWSISLYDSCVHFFDLAFILKLTRDLILLEDGFVLVKSFEEVQESLFEFSTLMYSTVLI